MNTTANAYETRDYGRLNLRIDRHATHTSITVTHHDGLDRAFPNNGEADAYLAFLQREEATGVNLVVLTEMAGAWTSAAAIVDQAEQAMLDGIAANMQAAQPATIDVSDIMADADPNWARNLRNETVQAAKQSNAAADTVGATTRRSNTGWGRRDYTKGRVGCKPPTPAEMDRIRNHRDGIVTLLPGQPWTLLQAIEARGYGTGVRVDPRRPKLKALRLNARGLALVEQDGQVAA